MALKKSNLGIHDASKHLNREAGSQLDQIIFDLGIHSVDKNVSWVVFILLRYFHLRYIKTLSYAIQT